MIERLSPLERGFDVNAEILFGLGLADVLGEARGTQGKIVLAIFFGHGRA